jgi:hypothetical protein
VAELVAEAPLGATEGRSEEEPKDAEEEEEEEEEEEDGEGARGREVRCGRPEGAGWAESLSLRLAGDAAAGEGEGGEYPRGTPHSSIKG